jgi:hypothetical protein
MAAGDVLFVGWTGGSPNYKELAPQIQIEPSAIPGFINKRVTINRICFDKDKPAVVQGFQVANATLSSVYIDTDGSVQTVGLGGGYQLLSISDAPIAKGFSRVSAQYSKDALGLFEVGLPFGFSVEQDSGICRIKYLTHVLEEFDSGTGVNSNGLEFRIEQWPTFLPPNFDPVLYEIQRQFIGSAGYATIETFPGVERFVQIYAQYVSQLSQQNSLIDNYSENKIALRASAYCNNVLFDTIEIAYKNIGIDKTTTTISNTVGPYFSEQEAEAQSNTLYFGRNSRVERAVSLYYRENDEGRFILKATNQAPTYFLVIDDEYEWYDIRKISPFDLYPRWLSVGNVHKIMVGAKTWREYDVTGLS